MRFTEGKGYLKREGFKNPGSVEQRQHEEFRPEQIDKRVLRSPGYDTGRRTWTAERERRVLRSKTLNHIHGREEGLGGSELLMDEWEPGNVSDDSEIEHGEGLGFEDSPNLEDEQAVNAIDGDRTDKRKGCFWKYMYGECNNKDCTMDHREETIQGMWKKKVWDLAKAVKSPGSEVLVSELQRALRDTQASSNANTRT